MNRLVRHQLRYGGGYELRSKAGLTQVCMQAVSKAHTVLVESDGSSVEEEVAIVGLEAKRETSRR
jgi:hypothetical protein